MFHDKACVAEDFGHDVVTTKKESRRQFVTFLLRNKKTVIYKRKDIRRNFFFKVIYSFFECFYNWGHVHSGDNRGEGRALTYAYVGVE